MSFLLCLLLLASITFSAAISNSDTSLTLLFQNNLNASDDPNHIGFFVLDEFNQKDGAAACKSLNETLLSSATIKDHQSDVLQSLSYNAFAGRSSPFQAYWIKDGLLAVAQSTGDLTFHPPPLGFIELPVLCTQSSNGTQPGTSKATFTNKISVASGGNTYVGYRNTKSFRFLGIPYADPPQRFVYSTPYSQTGKTLNATGYGAQCAQVSTGSENCLFLNIQTPYIPKQGSTDNLRPVMFWIHGGGFTGGSGADPGSDGGNLASREDIVVVNINYRLSTLGFLAIPGTNITGNYGIADQINALDVSPKHNIFEHRLMNVVDDQEHCLIWRRSKANYHNRRISWRRLRPDSSRLSPRNRQISGRSSNVQPRWRRRFRIGRRLRNNLQLLPHAQRIFCSCRQKYLLLGQM